jgi:hypothetical protein
MLLCVRKLLRFFYLRCSKNPTHNKEPCRCRFAPVFRQFWVIIFNYNLRFVLFGIANLNT